MGVVRGSIPRESSSFCRRARRVVVVGVVVDAVGVFFGAEVRVDPLSTPRRDAREGEHVIGYGHGERECGGVFFFWGGWS
jgi:hypothetical protein